MLHRVVEQLVDGSVLPHDGRLVDGGQREGVGALGHRAGDVVLPDETEGSAVAVLHEEPGRLVLPQEPVGRTRAAIRAEYRVGPLGDRPGGQYTSAVDVRDEARDVVRGGIAEDLLGGADLLDPPVPHHRDPIPQAHRLIEVVGDEQDRLPELALQVDELVLHLTADERVECGEGLVHEQDVGLGGQGPSQSDPLTHSAGELAGLVVRPALEPDHREGPLGPAPAVGTIDALDLQTVGGVLPHRPVREEGEVLEDHGHPPAADLAQLLLGDAGQVLVVEGHVARGDREEPVHHSDQRGLAGPRQAHDDEDLALVDIEGGIDDGGRRAFLPEVITRLAGLESPHGGGRTPTKNFIDVIGLYYFHSAPRDPTPELGP